MKKLISTLIILFSLSLCSAGEFKFLGVPFGSTLKDAEIKALQKDEQQKKEKAFQDALNDM